MECVFITMAIVAIVNLYLLLFGGLTDIIVVSSGALLIGLLFGRIIAKLEDYCEDCEDYKDYYEDDDCDYIV